jgi:hypothetical protein
MRGLRKTKHVYLVEGIAACGCCGAPVGIASACSGGRRVPSPARYVCARRRRPDENGRCDAPYWLCSDVDSRIWAVLRETVRVPGRIERAARAAQASAAADGDTWRKDLVSAERRLASLTRAEAAILARFRSGSISEEALDIELAAAKRDREMAKLQVDAARRAQFAAGKKSKRASGIEQLVAELRNRVDSTSPAEQRELVTRLMPRGSVTLTIATIEMRVQLRRPVGSVSAAGCSSLDETIVEIRLVA